MAKACKRIEAMLKCQRANKSAYRGSWEEERGMDRKAVRLRWRPPTDAVTVPVGNANRGTQAATGARLENAQRSRKSSATPFQSRTGENPKERSGRPQSRPYCSAVISAEPQRIRIHSTLARAESSLATQTRTEKSGSQNSFTDNASPTSSRRSAGVNGHTRP